MNKNNGLAAAFAVQRMSKRKNMAKGGEVESLNPMNEPEHEAEDIMMKAGERLPKFAQEHEDIDEPLEPKEIYVAKEYNANKYRQMAKGGMLSPDHIVKGVMAKKMNDGGPVLDPDKTKDFIKGFSGVRNYAQGGELDPEYDYLDENESYPDPDDTEFDAVSPDSKEYRKRMIKGIFSKR